MRTTLGAFLALIVAASVVVAAEEPKTFPLWTEGAPGHREPRPAMSSTPGTYQPSRSTGPTGKKPTGDRSSFVPGGGYGFLATEHEGKDVAEWVRSLGLTAFVLKYRLAPRYKHPRMLEDAQRAIRTVRARASEWDLDPKRVAILGFSAGGHLASTAATHFDGGKADSTDPIDRQSSRPDLAILVYPVVAMGTPYGHTGSLKNLLGASPLERVGRKPVERDAGDERDSPHVPRSHE